MQCKAALAAQRCAHHKFLEGLPLQVVGFVVLVSGTSLYNELIRSCLPTMYESTVDSDAEVRRLHRSRMPVINAQSVWVDTT